MPDVTDFQTALAQATTCLARGDAIAAVGAARTALMLDPCSAAAHQLLGNACFLTGQFDEAAACYRRALALDPAMAEACCNLGTVLDRQGKCEEAAAALRQAVAIRADYAEAYYNLGNVLAHLDRLEEAIVAYRYAITLRTTYGAAIANLGLVLRTAGRIADGVTASRAAAQLEPNNAERHFNLGNALRDDGKFAEAADSYHHAAALQPDSAKIYTALGDVSMSLKRREEAYGFFRRASQLRPLLRRPAAKPVPDFSALFINTPAEADTNTNIDYLVRRAGYDSYFFKLLADAPCDIDLLRSKADVVVNLISDVDEAASVLPQAAELVARIGRPTINHPRAIMETSRDMVARRLMGIPYVRIPKLIRVSGTASVRGDLRDKIADLTFPVLVRLSGTHAGAAFEKCDDFDAAANFIGQKSDADHYVSEYVPYKSADGYFRKYRLIFVDGQVFPYHLAIHDDWMVHHFRTRMDTNAWMREEEKNFVENPATVFAPRHWSALRAIHAAISLDYFGIDCSFDRDGNLLVFEVNATMLVHGEHGFFAYKEPYIAQIKSAFDVMLAQASLRERR